MEHKKASYQEFTDQYNYIESDGSYNNGVYDHMTPLPDEQGKGPDDLTSNYDWFDERETSHKGEAEERELDQAVDFPYEGSNGSREKENTDFTDDLHYNENSYYDVQNVGKNIYFFMDSIPNGSTMLKGAKMKNDVLFEITASEEEPEIEIEEEPEDDHVAIQLEMFDEQDPERVHPERDENGHQSLDTDYDSVIVINDLPGAPPGSHQVLIQLEPEDEGEEVVQEVIPEQPVSKWDWKKSFPTGFIDWIKERNSSCPSHTGWDMGGVERACSHMGKLDSEIGRAMREDIDGHLDAKQIDGIRKQIEKGIDLLEERLEHLKKLKSKKKKKASDENHEIVKEAKISPGVISTSINVPYLIASLARACIMSTVSAGHDMEQIFYKTAAKFKLDDREKYLLRQCIADMGFQMQFDGTTLVGEEVDNSSQDNGEYEANYQGKKL